MTKEEFKACVYEAFHTNEHWEQFLECVGELYLQATPHWISVEDELPRCGLESRLQDYWQGVREHAAIAAMQGILCAPIVEGIDPNPSKEHIAELAVAQADALIEELKKK